MTLGVADRQGGLFDDVNPFCDRVLPQASVYAVLHRERERLFPDEMFADLFSGRGTPVGAAVGRGHGHGAAAPGGSVGPRGGRALRLRRPLAVRGRGGRWDGGGWARFAHTVLVDMRARLAASEDPRRIFTATVQAASEAGLVGARRVLDSTPLYDAVATMDTVT